MSRPPVGGSPPPARVAFVLQGGGSLTAPQVGMLRALLEAGVRPDLIVGSSAGALNAVAFATDPTPVGIGRLERMWRRLRRRHVAALDIRGLRRAVAGHDAGLLSAAPLGQLLTGLIADRLEQTVLPAHVVTTDSETGEAVIVSAGESVPALLASAAFPGIYPPVTIGRRRFIDGSVAADVPVRQAEQLGATTSYLLPAARRSAGCARGPMALAHRALGQILDRAACHELAGARGEVHVLPAVVSAASSPLDFRGTDRLLAAGYGAATAWLHEHVASVPAT
jgi:NTE family protein